MVFECYRCRFPKMFVVEAVERGLTIGHHFPDFPDFFRTSNQEESGKIRKKSGKF